jgi:hypothetical protein
MAHLAGKNLVNPPGSLRTLGLRPQFGRKDISNGWRFRLKVSKSGTFNQTAKRFQRKDLPARCEQHLFHVFASHAKASSRNAGNHFELWLTSWVSRHAKLAQMLNPRDFIPGCPVVLRELRFDNYFRVEFIRHDKIWRLIKAKDALRSLGLSITDSVRTEDFFDCGFEIVSDQFAD